MAGEKIMNRLVCKMTLATLSIGLAVSAQTTKPAQALPPAPTANPITPATQGSLDHGQRAFNANCSRCHNPIGILNPRITGTVIRHMRVRANLSAADERDILRFLNP
jgi:cytochrome c2